MTVGYPTGFPLPAGVFSGGASITGAGRGASLEALLTALVEWSAVRAIVDAPGDLAGIASPQDGWLAVVRESAGAGTPPAFYVYDANTPAWKNLLSTGLPASHASTHKNAGGDEVATATAAANAIPKAGAGSKLDVGWLPVGTGATDVCAGDDARLSDARTPTAHTHANGDLTGASATPAVSTIPISDGVTGKVAVGFLPVGATATDVCAGDDSRLSDARTPTSHTHANGDLTGASVTPAAATIPIAGAANEIDTWGAAPTGAVGAVWTTAAPVTIREAIDRIATAVSGLLAGPIP